MFRLWDYSSCVWKTNCWKEMLSGSKGTEQRFVKSVFTWGPCVCLSYHLFQELAMPSPHSNPDKPFLTYPFFKKIFRVRMKILWEKRVHLNSSEYQISRTHPLEIQKLRKSKETTKTNLKFLRWNQNEVPLLLVIRRKNKGWKNLCPQEVQDEAKPGSSHHSGNTRYLSLNTVS